MKMRVADSAHNASPVYVYKATNRLLSLYSADARSEMHIFKNAALNYNNYIQHGDWRARERVILSQRLAQSSKDDRRGRLGSMFVEKCK